MIARCCRNCAYWAAPRWNAPTEEQRQKSAEQFQKHIALMGELRYCHRFPPQVEYFTHFCGSPFDHFGSILPATAPTTWCGEFSPVMDPETQEEPK